MAVAGFVLERAGGAVGLIVDVAHDVDEAGGPVDVLPHQAPGLAGATAEIVQQRQVMPHGLGFTGGGQGGALLSGQRRFDGGGRSSRADQALGRVVGDDPVGHGGAVDTAQRGKDAGDQRLGLAREGIEQLLELQRGDGAEHPVPEDGEQVLVEGGAVAFPGGRGDEGLFADTEPLGGVVTEEAVLGQGLAGNIAGDDGFSRLVQRGPGAPLIVFIDGLAVGVHADFDLGSVGLLLSGHEKSSSHDCQRGGRCGIIPVPSPYLVVRWWVASDPGRNRVGAFFCCSGLTLADGAHTIEGAGAGFGHGVTSY